MKVKLLLSVSMGLALANTSSSQEESTSKKVDSLSNVVNNMQGDFDNQKKLKISGYIQAQFQGIDSAGAKSFAGGDFPAYTDKRFQVRRGRLKIAYEQALSQYVLQFDVTEKGVTVKDAYVKFTDPWAKAFSLTTGMQNRPFGYEVIYSSSLRESPERGRMSQTLFPNERDLGAMLTFQMPKTSSLNFLKIDAGMFNGTGAPSAGANTSDFDFQKDFIGHISINKSNKSEKIKYGLGASYYSGGWRQGTKKIYSNGIISTGDAGFVVDSTSTNLGEIAKRTYIGVDAQMTLDLPIGLTTLRAEYIQGTQPGISSSSTSPAVQPTGSSTTTANLTTGSVTTTTPFSDTYFRNFNGAYFYFLQNIGSTKHQLVFKYDWYDPNTNLSGDQIGVANTKTGAADIKYTTIGLGWIYHWDSNVKITLYYDMVKNENTLVTGYKQDLKDNVITVRVQYKF